MVLEFICMLSHTIMSEPVAITSRPVWHRQETEWLCVFCTETDYVLIFIDCVYKRMCAFLLFFLQIQWLIDRIFLHWRSRFLVFMLIICSFGSFSFSSDLWKEIISDSGSCINRHVPKPKKSSLTVWWHRTVWSMSWLGNVVEPTHMIGQNHLMK